MVPCNVVLWYQTKTLCCEGQIPLGPVPRNFLVANVTRKSPTSCGLVTRKSGVSGVSPTCYEEVTTKLTTSRGSYEELVPVEFGLNRARIVG